MDQSESSQGDGVTATKSFKSAQLDKAEKKKICWERALGLFKWISLVEYRTPMYFSNKDSYKSATSGVLTLLSGLVLVVLFFNIFIPIFKNEQYNSEITQIAIRGEQYDDGSIDSCNPCRNYTVREALESTFKGRLGLIVASDTKEPKNENECKKYKLSVVISGLDLYYDMSFNSSIEGCIQQAVYNSDIIKFFEEQKKLNQSIPLS